MGVAISASPSLAFEYGYTDIDRLRFEVAAVGPKGQKVVTSIIIEDEPYTPSPRFWNSLQARFGFTSNIFKFFEHDEVLTRVAERAPKTDIRYCIEQNLDTEEKRIIAVTNPTRPLIKYDYIMNILDQYGGSDVRYYDGIVSSTHIPRIGSSFSRIHNDNYQNQFHLETPIDGYGRPGIWLQLFRDACQNDMIGYCRAFKSELTVGKGEDINMPVIRALESYNNDEGYAALRDRFHTAGNSWASVREAYKLYDMLLKMLGAQLIKSEDFLMFLDTMPTTESVRNTPGFSEFQYSRAINPHVSPIISAFHSVTGDTSRLYGMANVEGLSVKKQAGLPVKCKVLDLFNFATEVGTHLTGEWGRRTLNGYVGQLASNDFDLENSCDEYPEFADFVTGAVS